MEKTKIDAFSEWIDTRKNRKEVEDTLRRLEKATSGHDIAYSVVTHLQGVNGIDSDVVLSAKFIKTIIAFAPKLEKGSNVHSVRYHIRNMVRELEWREKENRQEMEVKDDRAKTYVLIVKKIMEWKKAEIENFLMDDGVDYEIIKCSDFDGTANSDETAIQIEGEMGELFDILKMIETEFGQDVLENISLTSVQDKFGRDALTMSQTIYLLQDE